MTNRVINIGVLAHVDAGKTSLSERLLFNYGSIKQLGSVDSGSTKMDSTDLEKERGITIQSAVAALKIQDLQINLVDTPGHPDFIAEVERALAVLDGAILVISAVEGVQAQTRVIMRSLKAASIPTIIFINKIDRLGARSEYLVEEIERKLNIPVLPVTFALNEGGDKASVIKHELSNVEYFNLSLEKLSEMDLELLRCAVDDQEIPETLLQQSLVKNTAQGKIYPLMVGSALSGQGIEQLALGIIDLLPNSPLIPTTGEPSGKVFAVSRDKNGNRTAMIRLFEGEISERDEIHYSQQDHKGQIQNLSGKCVNLKVLGSEFKTDQSNTVSYTDSVLTAGNIGQVQGLREVRVGANIGIGGSLDENVSRFPSPSLEAVINSAVPGTEQALYSALLSLSDEDPLIHVRLQKDRSMSVLLFGEVQKEVIEERLLREFGLVAKFSETTTIFFERLQGKGHATYEIDPLRHNDFWATVGLILEPNPIGTGNTYSREVPWGQMPPGFYRAIEESAFETLEQGLRGWPVLDCHIRLVKLGYDRPITVAADFRCITPILTLKALQQAKTKFYEPCQLFELEMSKDTLGNVMTFLTTCEAEIHNTEQLNDYNVLITGELPSRSVQTVAKNLPGLTHGEAAFITFQGKDRLYTGPVPARPRQDGNPLNYEEYLRYLSTEGLMR